MEACCRVVRNSVLILSILIWLPRCGSAQIRRTGVDQLDRIAAVKRVTDQAELANIAVEDDDPVVQDVAISMITDQELLGKIVFSPDKPPRYVYSRGAALRTLTDQSLVATAILKERTQDWHLDPDDYKDAVNMLTSQTLLAKVAVETKSDFVRTLVAKRVEDQSLLRRLALTDENSDVRSAAVERLTDEALLAEIAVKDKDADVRASAFAGVRDELLLARLVADRRVPTATRFFAIERGVPGVDFRRLAGNLGVQTSDAIEAFGRLHLALTDPIIAAHSSGIAVDFSSRRNSVRYGMSGGYELLCEEVTLALVRGSTVVASETGDCSFPQMITYPAGTALGAFPHRVSTLNLAALMAAFFSIADIPEEDLIKLARSGTIYEIRSGAVDNMRDRASLTKLALEDKSGGIRARAKSRLSTIRRGKN